MTRTVLSAIDRISAVLGRVAEVVVLILITSMLYEVVARYVFGAPTIWAFDIAYMSTGVLFVLGAAQTLREDGHVRIDVLSSRFPARLRGWIDGIAFLVILCPIFGKLAWIAWQRSWRAWATHEVEHVSPWAPLMWPFYSLLTIGLAALALQLAAQGIRALIAPAQDDAFRLEADMLTASMMFPGLFVLILLGLPIAFSLTIVSVVAGIVAFGPAGFNQLYGSFYSASTNFILSAIPMFILMGALLERSGVAERLFRVMSLWLEKLPGGIALATIAMGGVFAAAAGVVGAVEVMIGMMAIPAMQRLGYDNRLIWATICAGGSLGTMIPPSVIAVMYASLAQISVGKLLAGMMLPGFVMVAMFLAYIVVQGIIRPTPVPLDAIEDDIPTGEKLWLTVTTMVPVFALIFAVLGSILGGIASPTEAAAVGAAGALLLCIGYGRFRVSVLRELLAITVRISAMILLIVAAGTMFMGVFAANGGAMLIRNVIEGAGLGTTGMIVFFLIVVFLLGFVLDWTANVLICVPLFTPFIRTTGIDPVWFATMVIIVIQTSYLTPPMASAIFYLKSIAPKDMTYGQMCQGVVPFVGLQLLTRAIVAAFPLLVTWLPDRIVGL